MGKTIYLIALLGVMASCNFCNNHYTKQLEYLDSQLENNAEMVWDSLKQIDTKPLNESQKAYYYLLNASATDKNLVYLENDSTLQIALEYYKDNEDYYNLARCQYYQGKYSHKRGREKNAYELFKLAETNLKLSKKDDSHLLGLIYYQLGFIQKLQGNYFEAETFFQKSFGIFTETRDTISAVHSLKYKGAVQIMSKNYEEAEKDLFKSLELITNLKDNSEKAFLAKSTVLSTLSLLYRRTNDLSRSMDYCKRCMSSYRERNQEIPSQHHYNASIIFQIQNQKDSALLYCNKMISAAKNENHTTNLINGYKILSIIAEKEENYKEACQFKNYSSKLKDSLNQTISNNNILELEQRYEKTENQRLLLKAENAKLKAYAIITLILFGILIIGIPLYNRYKKLKIECDKLSEEIKHTEWGFLVTKEFITENHIAYDELERMLNREKGLNNISSEIYTKFHEALIQQKADYSGRLFNRLTTLDGTFATKFQQLFPEFNTDELLLATMIHHQWKITDMITIFRVSVEAVRKRKGRLAHKISIKLKREIDLEDFLNNL